jgi:hypothetical protein
VERYIRLEADHLVLVRADPQRAALKRGAVCV